jgi:hypothetical protein
LWKDRTVALSKLNSTTWRDYVLRRGYKCEHLTNGSENSEQMKMLLPYFKVNRDLPSGHPFFRTSTSLKQYHATVLKETGWTHRLEWCLNHLYKETEYSFAICFDNDWNSRVIPTLIKSVFAFIPLTYAGSTCWFMEWCGGVLDRDA